MPLYSQYYYFIIKYQEDMFCSNLCFFLQSHSGKSQSDRVWEHCCPLHSSGPRDKHFQIHLTLGQQSGIPLDSRNLREKPSMKRCDTTPLILMWLCVRQTQVVVVICDLAGRAQRLPRGRSLNSRSLECSYDTGTPPPACSAHCGKSHINHKPLK